MSAPAVGILGTGAIAAYHARALAAAGAPAVAAVGVDEAQLAAFGAAHAITRTATRLDEALVWPDVEAWIVATPNDRHVEHTLAAVAAGRHVLCEIPLAMSERDARAVADAAARAGVLVMVGHTQRWWGPLPELRARVAGGELAVHHVMAQTGLLRRDDVGLDGRPRPWTDHALWHHGAHLVDTALGLVGTDVVAVTAAAGAAHPQTGRPLDLALTLRTADGRLASLAVSYSSHLPVQDLLVAAEGETIHVRGARVERSDGRTVDHGDPGSMQQAATAAQDAHFLRAVAGERPLEVSASAVLDTYRVLQAASDLLAEPS